MKIVHATAWTVSLLVLCGGCRQRESSKSGPALEKSGPALEESRPALENVTGMLSLRKGAAFPKGARLRVVIRWYDEPLAEHLVTPADPWPIKFVVPIKWPYGKGMPSTVSVHAQAELGGRTVMISDTGYVHGWANGPIDLVLYPAIE